jgi:ring-1,2-phenylacetyl-CoA epoxidase subunit PaaE
MNFHSLKIHQIVSETTDSKTFYFNIPSNLKEEFNHLPGQYLTIKSVVGDKEIRRAYSICTKPGEEKIGCTVKKVAGGKMSCYLNDTIKEGEALEVMTPEGHFVVKTDHMNAKDHYFIAAGSGITPVMSMLKTILEEEPKSTCYLLYGNRDEGNIIFKEQLDTMAIKYADQLHVEYLLSQPKVKKTGGIGGLFGKKTSDWKGKKGRIDSSSCREFLRDYVAKNKDSQYYICGPGDMILNIDAFLMGEGINKKSIHKEYFTAAGSGEKATGSQEVGKVNVTLKGKNFDIVVPKDKTILDVLVDLKMDPPYSCTSGACSTCIAKVTEGEVVMDQCFALEDDEIEAGFVLTCQSHPKTTNVILTYDI